MQLHKILFLSLFLFTQTAFAESPTPDTTIPKDLTVMGNKLVLKENQGDSKAFIAEYIPASETFDNWTFMFATRFMKGEDLSAETTARATVENIAAVKKAGDPVANSVLLKAPDGKSYAVDFLVSANNLGVLEHNVWRYYKVAKGIVSLQIARRFYAKGADQSGSQNFIKGIPEERNKMLEEIMRKDLPVGKIAGE